MTSARLRPPRSATEPPPIWNIRELGLPFQGRDDQIAALLKLFTQYGHVLLHDAAAPLQGFGKTQMALAYCRRYHRRYDVAWWFECNGETDDDRLCGLIDDQYRQLREKCAQEFGPNHEPRPDKRWLFVYDNVPNPDRIYEHFVPGAGHRLVTSRSGGETWGKNRLELGGLSQAQAEALLLDQAEDQLDSKQAEHLASLIKGHPGLLLEVAEEVLHSGFEKCARALTPAPRTDPDTPPGGMVLLAHARAADQSGRPLSPEERRTLIEELARSPVGRTRDAYDAWVDSVRYAIGPTQLTLSNDSGATRTRIVSVVNFALSQETSMVMVALADALEELGEDEAGVAEVRRLVNKAKAAWTRDPRQ
ncbi:effector-associated domain 2-containing protein [Streptomyces sp. NBC_00996]|uniref:effector-associated domain 2-containing protein n=1 Tax=Streptomyces sp. NBC_00996 TaxID=2903710 RepID=UPI00386A6FA8|nr:hypothetical protein OG390_26855 [Streptomyces sp. NBC_00996]